jgi:hypothetical protein
MTKPIVVRLKPELGGRLAARAERLKGFTRKVGPIAQVVADLNSALALADQGDAEPVRIYVYTTIRYANTADILSKEFYSAIGEIVTSGRTCEVSVVISQATEVGEPQRFFEEADPQPAEPPFRARLAADWPRNTAAAPLILAAGGIGGGLAAAAGFAPFGVAAPVAAVAALLGLSLVFTAVSRP